MIPVRLLCYTEKVKTKWWVLLAGVAGLAVMAWGLGWLRTADKETLTPPLAQSQAKLVRDDYQPQRLRYHVEAGEKIKAVMAGRVTHIGPVDGAGGRALNLILHNAKTAETISYLLPDNTQVKVKVGQRVRAGRLIAVIHRGGQNLSCLGRANLSLTYLKDGRIVPIGEGRWR